MKPAAPTLSLVIPAYNEEARLPSLFDALGNGADVAVTQAGLQLVEVVVVDDGSTDRTPELLRIAASDDPRLKPVVEFDHNRGKGAAVAGGAARTRGEYVLLADVDFSTPLKELAKLSAAVRNGADIAIGSRAVPGAVVERGPAHRKILGKGFNGTVRLLTGLEVRDTQCGFKLMRSEVARQLLAEQLCPGFAFDVELLMRATMAGLKIAEVPIVYVHDSRSRVRPLSASYRMARDVTRLAFRLRRRGGPTSAAG